MTTKHKIILLDTSVVIRYLLGEELENGESAVTIFSKIESGSIKAIVPDTVFTKCTYILDKVYSVLKPLLVKSLASLLQYNGLNMNSKPTLLKALDYFRDTNLHIADCLLVAPADTHTVELITFDEQLDKFANHKEETF